MASLLNCRESSTCAEPVDLGGQVTVRVQLGDQRVGRNELP